MPNEDFEKFLDGIKSAFKENPTVEDLTKTEYARALFKKIMENRKDSDYEIDPIQFQKLLILAEYFEKLAKSEDAELKPIDLIPSDINGEVTLKTEYIGFVGYDEVLEFCANASLCYAIDITGNLDGSFDLSFAVQNVFRRKKS